MSLEDFQLIDNEPIDNSIVKRDFTKVYHQSGATLKDSNQSVEFIFGENNNYHQIGNGYFEFDITIVRHTAGNFTNASAIRLINNDFAYCFKEGPLKTTGGMDIEHNNFVGPVSTIMRLLTSKDGDLSSYFDKNGESVLDNDNPPKQLLINNHPQEINKGKIKGQLALEHIFGFCKTFEKITKKLGLHLKFEVNDLQDIIFTTIADDINVTINSLYLYIPQLIPSTSTQVLFKESIMNNYTINFHSWFSERKISNDGRELQVDIGSAQNFNSPKYLISAFQTIARTTANKAVNPAIFDDNHVTKYIVEIDGILYPKDGVLINFEGNSYLDQNRDSKLFYKEYVGGELLQPYISYPDMKYLYPIQITDLRHQVDHLTPKKIQLFQEVSEDPANERLFLILIRHRQVERISDGKKLSKLKLYDHKYSYMNNVVIIIISVKNSLF